MQRWIALAVVALMLLAGGGYYARKIYRENRPHPMWVPIQINPEYPPEKVDAVMKDIKTRLSQRELLIEVSHDLELSKQWGLPGDPQAADELKKRLFVKLGDMQSGIGTVPAIHIGVRGKAKEMDLSGRIAMRLMDDVGPALGIRTTKD